MALSLAGVQQAGLEVLLGQHEVVAGCQWAIRGRDHAAALRASEGLLLLGRARRGARLGFALSAVRVAAHLPAAGVPAHRLQVVVGVLVVVPAQATKGARVRRRHAQAHVALPVESQRKPRGCGHYHVVAAQVSLQERVQVEGQRHELAVHLWGRNEDAGNKRRGQRFESRLHYLLGVCVYMCAHAWVEP